MATKDRTPEEIELIWQAKRRLMSVYMVPEPKAHKALQHLAMQCRIPLTEAAQKVLDGIKDEETSNLEDQKHAVS